MRIWVHLEDIPCLAFVVPPHLFETQTLIRFNLSLLMGYLYSSHYLCCTSYTIANLFNSIWGSFSTIPLHHINYVMALSPDVADDAYIGVHSETLDASLVNFCTRLLPESNACLLYYVNVYIDYFITLVQGYPAERHQIHHHILHAIERVLQLYDSSDSSHKEPNSTKKCNVATPPG